MRFTEKIKENDYWDKMELNYDQSNTSQIVDKLGQLEDIEDELGIDLITLFKALKNGIHIRYDGKIIDITDDCLYLTYRQDQWLLDHYILGGFYTKDYGKTWALTKEELE